MAAHELGIRAERARADHRIRRRVDVGDGREVPVDPNLAELGSDRRGDDAGQLGVVDGAECGGARVRAPRLPLQTRDVAALLVGGEQEIAPFRAQRGAKGREPLARRHVVREQHDATAPAGEKTPHPVRRGVSWKARKDAGGREPLELGGHPRTAPAVRPNAIRRWTSRKKITTGMAVRDEAAISAPQSVCRLEPRKYESHTVIVCLPWSFRRTRAKMYSFQVVMKANTEVATRPGPISGSRIFRNTPRRVDPSTIAASSSSFGIPIRKPRSVHTQNGNANVR